MVKKNFTRFAGNHEKKMVKYQCIHCPKEYAYHATRMNKNLIGCQAAPDEVKNKAKGLHSDDPALPLRPKQKRTEDFNDESDTVESVGQEKN